MKKNLHPNVKEIEITCTTCGNKFAFDSIKDDVKVDVCSNCHPFYTGKQSDGAKKGRIDRFNKKLEKKS